MTVTMPTKRQILDALTRDELLDILDDYQLEVADRRKKDLLLDAVAASKKARPAEFLEQLPRNRLKDVCRALDLDDSGKAKAEIVARLLGQDGKPAQGSLFEREPGNPATACAGAFSLKKNGVPAGSRNARAEGRQKFASFGPGVRRSRSYQPGSVTAM